MHYACCIGAGDTVRNQLCRGANLEARNDQNHTPLHSAVVADQTDIVRTAQEKGADNECVDSHSQSPLYLAAFHSHHRTLVLLLMSGAIVAHRTRCSDVSRLFPLRDHSSRSRTHLAFTWARPPTPGCREQYPRYPAAGDPRVTSTRSCHVAYPLQGGICTADKGVVEGGIGH